MIEINLLPKGYRKKSFSLSFGKTGLIMVAAGAGVVVMLMAVSFYQSQQISNLDENIAKARQRASVLQKDIRVVDALIDVKDKISKRMRAVEKLDAHRSAYVRILADLARNIPEFVWLAKLTENPKEEELPLGNFSKPEKGKRDSDSTATSYESDHVRVRQVAVEGYSFTLNALATFMINMMRSDYFDKVELVRAEERYLDNSKRHKAYNFVVACDLHYLSEEELRQLIAKVDDKSKAKGAKTSHKVLN